MCADQVVNPTAPHRIASAQVREASEAALAAVLQTITAPELLKIMTRIHAAHLQPHADAEALIKDLLEVSSAPDIRITACPCLLLHARSHCR